MSTLELTAHDAGYAMLIDETEYKYLVTHDDKPFAYFLNPAVYSSGASFVRWDEATTSWVVEDNHDLQYLDDRYGVGANFLAELYGRQPLGANLPGVFVQLDGSNALVEADVNKLRLKKAYTGAVVVPYLVVKVYEQRLASYTYYTWLGSPLADNTLLAQDSETLINTLALQLETALTAGGALHDAYKEFTGLDIVVDFDAASNTIEVSNMTSFDGYEVKGERAGEITSGHLHNPEIVIPGLTRIVGHEYYGFKPMRGMYTVFAPEKLSDLMKVVEDTIGTLTGITEAQKDVLRNQLGYHWYDFFRGQDQGITVSVPDHLAPRTQLAAALGAADVTMTVDSTDMLASEGVVRIGQELIRFTGKTATTLTGLTRGVDGTTAAAHADNDPVIQPFKDIRANVFIAALGSQLVGATVSVEDPENPGEFLEVATSQGINLSDSFSHVDEQFHTSQPTAQRFITGPYGARGVVNDDGTVTWLSDGYSV